MPSSHVSLHIHAVWATRNRAPDLGKEIRDDLHRYIGGIVRQLNCIPAAVGGVEDHVHLLFWMHPMCRPADVLRDVKKGSSHWMRTQMSRPDFAWQDGYAAFAVSQSHLPVVRAYIAGQEEHHRKVSPRDELIALFQEHGIEFDEAFIR